MFATSGQDFGEPLDDGPGAGHSPPTAVEFGPDDVETDLSKATEIRRRFFELMAFGPAGAKLIIGPLDEAVEIVRRENPVEMTIGHRPRVLGATFAPPDPTSRGLD